jgi:hypothetical protein
MLDPARFPVTDSQALRQVLEIPSSAVVVTVIGTCGQWHGVEVFAQSILNLVEVVTAFVAFADGYAHSAACRRPGGGLTDAISVVDQRFVNPTERLASWRVLLAITLPKSTRNEWNVEAPN